MQATWTNPETGKTLNVFVHEHITEYGETFLRVNKGDAPSPCTFRVRVDHTNVVLA